MRALPRAARLRGTIGRPAVGIAVAAILTIVYMVVRSNWETILRSDDYIFADVSEGIIGTEHIHSGRPLQRHVLFTFMVHPLFILARALGANPYVFPTAAWAAVGAAVFFAMTPRRSVMEAVLATACFGLSASLLLYAGVPETYVPTGTLVLVCLLLWRRGATARGWRHTIPYAVSLVALGLLNPLIMGFLVLASVVSVVTARSRVGQRAGAVLGVVLIPVVHATQSFIAHMTMPALSWSEAMHSGARYLLGHASVRNLLSFWSWFTVVVNLLLASVAVPPLVSFHDADVLTVLGSGKETLGGYLFTPSLAALVVFVGSWALALMRGGRPTHWGPMAVPYGLLIAAFLVWFNPREAILYTPAWVGVYLAAYHESLSVLPRRVRIGILAALAATVGWANLTVLARL